MTEKIDKSRRAASVIGPWRGARLAIFSSWQVGADCSHTLGYLLFATSLLDKLSSYNYSKADSIMLVKYAHAGCALPSYRTPGLI